MRNGLLHGLCHKGKEKMRKYGIFTYINVTIIANVVLSFTFFLTTSHLSSIFLLRPICVSFWLCPDTTFLCFSALKYVECFAFFIARKYFLVLSVGLPYAFFLSWSI